MLELSRAYLERIEGDSALALSPSICFTRLSFLGYRSGHRQGATTPSPSLFLLRSRCIPS